MRRAAPRLKWHKLRRRRSDAPFQRANLDAALRAGVACEVDLVLTADGHAFCLHDLDLDRETTGTGPASRLSRRGVESLRQRGNDGTPLADPPLFLDEVAAAVRRVGAAGPALVQLDLKPPAAALDQGSLARFGGVLGADAPAFIASGADWDAVQRLVAAAPGLHAGFDPLDLYADPAGLDAAGYRALAERTLAAAPGAAIYYLEARLVLAALDRGVDMIGLVARAGAAIDCWTLDAGAPDLAAVLRRLIDAGCDQITTNDPESLQPLIAEIAACS